MRWSGGVSFKVTAGHLVESLQVFLLGLLLQVFASYALAYTFDS